MSWSLKLSTPPSNDEHDMPSSQQAALTAANLRALSGAPPGAPAADGPDRMADLLERTQMHMRKVVW